MPRLKKVATAVILMLAWLSAAGFADTVQKAPVHKSHKKTETAPLPAYTPHTLSPLPLEQMPAVPPEVAYSAGQLTIVAHNSTLGDILRAVHSQTGAELDVPSNANERVVATLGPGPARDVLATLLNGTHFNYVMLGTPGDPSSVQRVVLTAKTGPETPSPTASAAAPPGPQGMPPNRFQQAMGTQVQTDQDAAPEDAAADAQDDSAESPDDQSQSPDQQQQNQGQAPKTPEQLLQELQRQQQLLQQQQQGQPGQPVQPGQPQVVYPNPTQPPDQN